jgi:site-specific DNA recombinase
MLKNPAYKGLAAFGKTKIVPRLPHLRQHRNRTIRSKIVASSKQSISKSEWIFILVPSIVDENLFETV